MFSNFLEIKGKPDISSKRYNHAVWRINNVSFSYISNIFLRSWGKLMNKVHVKYM